MVDDPVDTPPTVPVAETVATAMLPLVQLPPDGELLSVVVLPGQIVVSSAVMVGFGSTVIITTEGQPL